jgi:predicted RND superfamily exporter protein
MQNLLRLLRPLFNLNRSRPILVLVFSLLLMGVGGYFSLQLIKKIDTDIANLLPENTPSVIALNKLKDQVGGETSMEVAIKSKDFEAAKQFAFALIDSSLNLYDAKRNDYYFKRAEFKREVAILENNALYLATDEELNEITDYLNAEIESAKEEANPFFLDLEDEFDDEPTSSNDSGTKDLSEFQDIYREIVPTEYPVNEDSTVLVVRLYPTGSKSDTGYLEDMFVAYQKLIDDLNPAVYAPDIEVQFGGRLKRHLEEIQSIMRDVIGSFASGISSVLVLVLVYFFLKKYRAYRSGDPSSKKYGLFAHIIRAPLPLVIIGLPLIMALSYTFGITWFVYGMLNTMTSVLFVILFGMGIDYGLHFYARYIELRADGISIDNAMIKTYETTGQAIMTSALTTASALYILMIANFRGFSEFGFISGTGIILTLFTMIFVMPALLVLAERLNLLIFTKPKEQEDTPVAIEKTYPWARTVFSIGLLLTVLTLLFVHKLRFEYDFGKLEPVHAEYEAFKQFKGEMVEASKRNPAYILTDTDRQAASLLRAVRYKMESDTVSPTIKSVESIQERFPLDAKTQIIKLAKIEQVRELLKDPFLASQKDEWLDKLRLAAGTTRPLAIKDLPNFITDRFTTKSGDLGKFIIIYPNVGLSDGRNSIAFKDDVGKIETDINETFYAASTSIVAADMLDLMITESPYMVSATLVFIIIFMFFAFRSWRWTLISLLPLLVGLVFTFGIMLIFGITFNFYNLVVLPAILGIGEDNGVHLAARFREEGHGSMSSVLKSTGQHISIGSLTTMLGFAGLLFTSHPGLYSIGLLAVLGIGMTLFTALTFLPAMVQVLEYKGWMKYDAEVEK